MKYIIKIVGTWPTATYWYYAGLFKGKLVQTSYIKGAVIFESIKEAQEIMNQMSTPNHIISICPYYEDTQS